MKRSRYHDGPRELLFESVSSLPHIYFLEKEISNNKDANIISIDLKNDNKPIQDISPVMEGINLLKISNFKSEPIKKENDIYGNPIMKGPFSVFYLDSMNDSKESIFNLQFNTSDKQFEIPQGVNDIGIELVDFIAMSKKGFHLKDIEIKQKTVLNVENAIKSIVLENIKGDVPIEVYATDPITIVSVNSNIKVIVTYKNRKYLQNTEKQIEKFTNTDSLTNINLISIFIIFILGSVILYLINVKNCRLIN